MTEAPLPLLSKRDVGFALMEVLVATAIAAVSLAVIYGLLANASRSTASERATVDASIIARSLLAEVSAGAWPASGEFWSDPASPMRWRLRLQSSGDQPPKSTLLFLDVDLVVWHLGEDHPPLEFATEVAVPQLEAP